MEMTMRMACTPIGKTLQYGEQVLRVLTACNGCKGCAFDNHEGARLCPHSGSCMAHMRPDKKPVRFVVNE